MIIRPWIDAVGQHMWRFYFSRPGNIDPTAMTESNRLQYEACRRAISRFSKEEKEIIAMYFSSAWGKDLHTVDEYSKKTGIAASRIWDTVKAANRSVCEERGLIDRGV